MAQSTEQQPIEVALPASQPLGHARRHTILAAAWIVGLLCYLLLLAYGDLSTRATSILNDLAWSIASTLAAISSYRAARAVDGRERSAWLLFFAAATAWAIGQFIWNVYEIVLDVPVPFPSYSDLGYLAFGPLMIAGLFVLRTTQPERPLRWLRVANLSLILCSFAAVLVIVFTQPFLAPKHTLAVTLIVVSENATVTIAFVLALYLLWSYRWGHRLTSVTLLTLSIGAQMVSGVLYTRELIIAAYGATSFFNIGWIIAFALHQWAAELRRDPDAADGKQRQLTDQQEWVELLVPSFLLTCIAMTAFALAREISAGMIQMGSLILVAFAVILGIRESWLYAQGRRLRGQLDRQAAALKKSRERFDALERRRGELERVVELTARAGGVGLWEWDVRTNAVRLSPEWKRQLGYGEHEMADSFEEWRKRLHPEDRARVTAALDEYLKDPVGEYVSEQRLQHRDGSYRWILAQGGLVHDDAGRMSRMLGSHVDITTFKDLEQSLRDSEARYRELVDDLEQRVAERTRQLTEAYRESQNFAYAVAHDLKAPLRAIDGFNALLQESARDRLTDNELRLIDRARHGSIRMAALIEGLLNYSRLEHREQCVAATDCAEIVEGVLRTMADVLRQADAQVDVALCDVPVMADREGLAIVLRNLLENALKFSRDGVTPHIRIESAIEDEAYLLRVSDNGIGFDPEYREKIFEIFQRLHASGYEGTGIGLALVRKAVQRMNGRVWADSVPGEGSTFFVSLEPAMGAASPGGSH